MLRIINQCTASKLELRFKSRIENITKLSFYKIRPKWLINPKTNRALELDMYNYNLKLAIEYNGPQHYVYPNRYHKNIDEFYLQLDRDQIKVKLCNQYYIKLITIRCNYNLDNEIDQFYEQINDLNIILPIFK